MRESIIVVHFNISKRTMFKIGIEKENKVSINTVLVSTTRLDINLKISFVFYTQLGLPSTTIQIVRIQMNDFENRIRGKKANMSGVHVSKSKI